MYIIYRVDKDEDGFNKSVAGVVNGDEAEALTWIRQIDKHLRIRAGILGYLYPR